jgi:serine/threonine protein kinase
MSTSPRRLGRYELQELLGRGGMAEVWRAFDAQLQRSVAIKIMRADLRTDPDFVTRFIREARVIAALHHPNIVQIYDFHVTESAQESNLEAETLAYMVMDYVKGQTLAQYLQHTSRQKLFPASSEVVHLFTPISLALDYAHGQGMIHRDIKPANILLDARHTERNPMGEPILSDFGLAKLQGVAGQTMTGGILGTPLYISPEQVQNRPVSPRTDLYSLGVVLYEVFTGEPPFQSDNVASIMMKHLTEVPRAPHLINPALPLALSAVLLKSIAKDPELRFSSAAAMTAAIAQAFALPVPPELQRAASVYSDAEATILVSGEQDKRLANPRTPLPLASSSENMPARSALENAPTMRATANDNPAELVATDEPERITGAGHMPIAGATPLPVSSPGVMPSAPSRPRKSNRLYMILAVAVICVLVASALTSLLVFAHHGSTAHGSTGTATAVVSNTVVGQAFFVSSGKASGNTNQGMNDEFEIDLHNIPNPPAGKSYYAWLLPAASASESPPVFLGQLPVSNGNVHFVYQGDSQHTNLLAITSRFLITEQDAGLTVDVPPPDTTTWRYYAVLPDTPAKGQTYSLLDHLRHLLAADPELDNIGLHGGVASWAYKNVQKVQSKAMLAQADWHNGNFTDLQTQLVVILDYLDGSASVQPDVPAGTPIEANPQNVQIGLLQVNTNPNAPTSYLNHIDLHLNGVLTSPGATNYQRQIASSIYSEVNNLDGWLQQVRHDAVQLVQMNATQLAQQSSLALLNDMVTQATYAYTGQANASNPINRVGIQQIYVNIQKLATFDVTAYKQSS